MQLPMKKSLLPMKNLSSSEKQIYGKKELEKLLEQHFGYSGFRGKQLEAIQAVLSGSFISSSRYVVIEFFSHIQFFAIALLFVLFGPSTLLNMRFSDMAL